MLIKRDPDLSLFFDILRTLETAGIPYMIIGAYAGTMYGVSRVTYDIDIVVELNDAHIAALTEAYPLPRYYADPYQMQTSVQMGIMFNIQWTTRGCGRWNAKASPNSIRPVSPNRLASPNYWPVWMCEANPWTSYTVVCSLGCAKSSCAAALSKATPPCVIPSWTSASPPGATVSLRTPPNRKARVNALIEALLDQRTARGGSVLSLFLRILAENTDPDDACRNTLNRLAATL